MNFIITCYGYLRGNDIKSYTQDKNITIIHFNGTESLIMTRDSTDTILLPKNEHIEIQYQIDDRIYHKVCTGTVNLSDEVQIIEKMNCCKISRFIMRAELYYIESKLSCTESEEEEETNYIDITETVRKYSCNDTIEPNVILINNMLLIEYAKSINCNMLSVVECVNDDIDTVCYTLW